MSIEHTPLPRDILRVKMLGDYLYETAAYDSDPVESACKAALSTLLIDPIIESRVAGILTHRDRTHHDKPPIWALDRMMMSGAHMIEWSHIQERGEEGYQPEHEDPKVWKKKLTYLVEGDLNDKDYYDFHSVLSWKDLNTIKPNRRTPTEFIINSYFDDPEEPIDILDVGCSRNDLLVMMALNFPRKHIQMSGPDDSIAYETIFNQVINRGLPNLGQKIGIDRHPYPDDEVYVRWFNSNYLRFQKSHDKELVQLCNELGSQAIRDLAEVEQVSGDFSDIELDVTPQKRRNFRLKEAYDVITFSFMLYQLLPERREIAINRAKKMLKPNGLIIISDVVQVNPVDHSKFVFPDNDHKRVKTLVLVNNEEYKNEIQEVFEFEGGECEKGKVIESKLTNKLWLPNKAA